MRPLERWQDWASFALGLWLAVSPWMAGYADDAAATGNAVVTGLALALAAHFECVTCAEAPAEWLNLVAGAWLAASPFVLGFGSAVATANAIVTGLAVAALAVSALSLDKQFARLWHSR